jgi:hypothetical protein
MPGRLPDASHESTFALSTLVTGARPWELTARSTRRTPPARCGHDTETALVPRYSSTAGSAMGDSVTYARTLCRFVVVNVINIVRRVYSP